MTKVESLKKWQEEQKAVAKETADKIFQLAKEHGVVFECAETSPAHVIQLYNDQGVDIPYRAIAMQDSYMYTLGKIYMLDNWIWELEMDR